MLDLQVQVKVCNTCSTLDLIFISSSGQHPKPTTQRLRKWRVVGGDGGVENRYLQPFEWVQGMSADSPEMQTKSRWIMSELLRKRALAWLRFANSAACTARAISSSSWLSELYELVSLLPQLRKRKLIHVQHCIGTNSSQHSSDHAKYFSNTQPTSDHERHCSNWCDIYKVQGNDQSP